MGRPLIPLASMLVTLASIVAVRAWSEWFMRWKGLSPDSEAFQRMKRYESKAEDWTEIGRHDWADECWLQAGRARAETSWLDGVRSAPPRWLTVAAVAGAGWLVGLIASVWGVIG